jgi:outer membrane protein assembly factor BamA
MYKILILILLISVFALPQQNGDISGYYPVVIDSIQIIGNETTDEDIITRELTFSLGDSISYDDILYNRERIFSLGIFNRVDLYTIPGEEQNILMIDVEESWYIYPLPFAELKDKSWDKISYGLDFVIRNFRGRNELVRVRAALGYDPSIYFHYSIPSLTSDGNYYMYTDLNYGDVRNKSTYARSLTDLNFDQKFITTTLGLGRRFGVFHRASTSIGFSYVESPFYITGISASPERIDRFPHLGLNYVYDTRDLAQFPRDGIYFNSAVVFKGMGINDINYQIANLDFREYRPIIGELAGKWRLAGRFGFGDLIPTYDFSYIGFGERIRGFFTREMEGHHLYFASAELFYPLLKEVRINLDFIPLIPDELLHYRAGLFLQVFTDAGMTKFKHQKFSLGNFASGYGTGFTFLILPYNIMRIEFAVSEYGETEWIIDLGISF